MRDSWRRSSAGLRATFEFRPLIDCERPVSWGAAAAAAPEGRQLTRLDAARTSQRPTAGANGRPIKLAAEPDGCNASSAAVFGSQIAVGPFAPPNPKGAQIKEVERKRASNTTQRRRDTLNSIILTATAQTTTTTKSTTTIASNNNADSNWPPRELGSVGLQIYSYASILLPPQQQRPRPRLWPEVSARLDSGRFFRSRSARLALVA